MIYELYISIKIYTR